MNEANIVYEEHGPKFHLSQTNFNKYLENPEPTEITRAKFSPTNKYLAAIQGRSIQVNILGHVEVILGHLEYFFRFIKSNH